MLCSCYKSRNFLSMGYAACQSYNEFTATIKRKTLILSKFKTKIAILFLDVSMYSMAAYQNVVDDICDDFKLDRDQITLVKLLGAGNFGQVSKAIYGASQSEVAVKSLKGNSVFCFLAFFTSLSCLYFKSQLTAIQSQ